MLRLRQQDLPYRGASHHFVGGEHSEVGVSAFLFRGRPGEGPGLPPHPCDEVQFIREGRGRWEVDGVEFEAGAGEMLVIKAGEVCELQGIGDAPLVPLDVHLSPRFIQENLG